MTSFAGGDIEAFVGPPELGAADDLEQTIISFIGAATESLDIAVQELDSLPIAQAILDARWRGVLVRLVVEQDYLQDEKLPNATPKPGETAQEALWRAQWRDDPPSPLDMNRWILTALLRSTVHVSADYNPSIFHQKFAIRDYRGQTRPTSALLSGSANFTHTDTHANLNHVVIFHDYRICKAYQIEFAQINAGSFGRNGHGAVPRAYSVNGVTVKVLFAPDHTPELELMKQVMKATQKVRFAIFTFAGSSGIDDALIMAKRAGFDVQGALDPGQASQKWAATKWLHEAGVGVFLPKRVPGFGKLHHKLMVVDESTTVAGSFNYTAPANDYNDENLFVIGTPYPDLPADEEGPVDPQECLAVAQYFRTEIDRIIAGSNAYDP